MQVGQIKGFLAVFAAVFSFCLPGNAIQKIPSMNVFLFPEVFANRNLQFRVKFDRLSLPQGLTISSSLYLNMFDANAGYYVELNSPYFLVNGVNLGAVNAQLIFKGGNIIISYFDSKKISLKGTVKKDTFNLNITVKGMNIKEINRMCGFKPSVFMDGRLRGNMYLSGSADNIFVRGGISIFDGVLEEILYKKSVMNFEGDYPYLKIYNSYVEDYGSSVFDIQGYADFMSSGSKRGINSGQVSFESSLSLTDRGGKIFSLEKWGSGRPDWEGVKFTFDLDKSKTICLKVKPQMDNKFLGKDINF